MVQSIAERPIIGISWKKDSIGSDYSGFAEAFERNGAISVFLPQVKTEEEAADVLSSIDGIFFTAERTGILTSIMKYKLPTGLPAGTMPVIPQIFT